MHFSEMYWGDRHEEEASVGISEGVVRIAGQYFPDFVGWACFWGDSGEFAAGDWRFIQFESRFVQICPDLSG